EWQVSEPLLPTSKGGRPRKWSLRQIVNPIFYVTRSGCAWRMAPKDFPPWQTVYAGRTSSYFRRCTLSGLWQQINAALVKQVRVNAGRRAKPSAGVIDSQRVSRHPVKTSQGGEQRGIDVHKQTPGRKRHIVVDTLRLLLIVVVHRAGIPDGTGGKLTLARLFARIKGLSAAPWRRLKTLWADGGYENIVDYVRLHFGWSLDIARRPEGAKGWVRLPHRWIVERTFAWLGRYRRLARDYEHTVTSSEAMAYCVSIRRMLKLVAA
ncbi:MAG: IS5 family transposase, partial [Candidatus Roseilinea sp.]|uniref:IS5 family transposase n=1 Tax=Candidatus Roseilinea sp. TaxID=2838777 RepID=UPI00404A754A